MHLNIARHCVKILQHPQSSRLLSGPFLCCVESRSEPDQESDGTLDEHGFPERNSTGPSNFAIKEEKKQKEKHSKIRCPLFGGICFSVSSYAQPPGAWNCRRDACFQQLVSRRASLKSTQAIQWKHALSVRPSDQPTSQPRFPLSLS